MIFFLIRIHFNFPRRIWGIIGSKIPACMKLTFLLSICLFTFAAAARAAAQETCALENSPPLSGLRLGMSPEQAQGVFGKDLKIKFKTKDEKIIFQNYIEKPAPPSLAGVRALYLRFFDRRLYQIEIFYEERSALKTLKDFTDALSASGNFPASAWQSVKGRAVINCGQFTLVADKVLNPHVELTDETARAGVEAVRKEKSKEK